MKCFMDGTVFVGSAGDAKKYLRKYPTVTSLRRNWWYAGGELLDSVEFTREEILSKSVKELSLTPTEISRKLGERARRGVVP